MPMRLQELHAALVHYPIALIPIAAGLAMVGALGYSAYFGGHMVYELGVGINDRGLNEERA